MYSLGKTIKSNFKIKPKLINIDNFVFKLHYRLTCWIILFFTGILCFEEYNKTKIQCTHSDPTDSKKHLEHVINSFCFFMTTFTVPRHANKTSNEKLWSAILEGISWGHSQNILTIAHPGVGPLEENEEVLRHWYYQWVPYVLFFQGLSFYLPYYLWKSRENSIMKNLVEEFNFIDYLKKEKEDRDKNFTLFTYNFDARQRYYKSWFPWLVFCEFLNLINIFLQMYITDLFLGGYFWSLGTSFYEHFDSETFNPLDMIFPKVSKCTFQKYGASGSIQQHDVVCILTLNIINEKIYIILWYWYILLAICTVLNLLYRLVTWLLFCSATNFSISTFQYAVAIPPKQQILEKLKAKYNKFWQWSFILNLASNLDGKLACDLLEVMSERRPQTNIVNNDEEKLKLLDQMHA